ncbi:MAG TPA: DNA repair protein RecN [Candidatus Limnocylindrales bacterium]|nr:DNA repair protein RecN [Candidatus Limnocylindrales bacterium]
MSGAGESMVAGDGVGRLLEVSVRDLALIERLRLQLEPGLNVLTGETGAGKSLLIDALGLALGARADTTLVRHGAEAARVEALFDRVPEPLIAAREVGASGRSTARLDDGAVTAARLAEAVGPLVEIHGQHEQSRLLDERWQRELLDAFGDHRELRLAMSRAVERWRENRSALEDVALEPREVERRLEVLRHEVEEIGGARLRAGEAAELRELLERARHGEAISRGAAAIRAALDGEGTGASEGTGVREGLASAVSEARSVARIDARFEDVAARLAGLEAELEDAAADVRRLAEGLDHDAASVLAAEERLSRIYSLERRYGEDEAAVLAHGERAAAEIERLEGLEGERRRREADDAKLLAEVSFAAAELSGARRAAAATLGVAADEALRGLGFRVGAFSVEVGRRAADKDEAAIELDGDAVAFDPTGADEVVFRFAPNPGEPARSLAKIASGGELSRVALAIKQVLAAADETPTLVFDEVDAGIGGRTADPVGRSLWALARNHQVLVVTHLPQIAAHADAHFRIAKRERDGRTVTEVEQLDREGRIVELAAMLGGGPALGGPDPSGTTNSGLIAVGPGPEGDGDGDLDAEAAAEATAASAEAGPPPAAGAALAAARELLDAAEAWRGRPVVPVVPV